MDNGKYYKTAFAVGWIANLALWILVVWVLIRALIAPLEQSTFVIAAFVIFTLLFIGLTIAFVLFLRTKNYYVMLAVIVFIVSQFMVVLSFTLAIYSDDRIIEHVKFADDPIVWIQNRRWLPIAFSVVFLPLFLVEIYVINRYSQHVKPPTASNDENGYQRKATPYHTQKDPGSSSYVAVATE
ncbi:hypothetical protein M3Y94_00580600 [Aphelenchoides besseyi]|nr:hypothetical protein M3Y94_00580600 [Aphelenchoides besseyi]